MKLRFLASSFHVASDKDNMYHYTHCPTGSDNWCKCNANRTNNSQTYKPWPDLPKDIIYKRRPIFLELSKDPELEKCLHGKTQHLMVQSGNVFHKILLLQYLISMTQFRICRYDAVAHFNIGT